MSCFIEVSCASSVVVHGRSRIGLLPPRRVGISEEGGFISSDGSVAGLVSLGLGVNVTVEVMATGGGGDKVGVVFGIAFPQRGHGFGAGNALSSRTVDSLCNSPESDSSVSSYSNVGGGAGVGPLCVELGSVVDTEIGISSDLGRFGGGGFSIVRLRCFDRTGTGIVVLMDECGFVGSGFGSG